ncbi:MAG: molybdenum cofactor biosynthesis protein MoaE [Alphaproteobacteria bacterium]|nr:molybdenum cofactor biosynthesis protein MoaE [Alphaproteobacteria bacterium]
MSVRVRAELAFEPIDAAAWLDDLRQRGGGHGALVSFEGVVRPVTKEGEPLDRLVLDHHPRMTAASLVRIANDGAARFDVNAVSVVHRAGSMSSGEIIVLVAVASDHRREAFQCADYLMDRLKTEAVFWKREEGPFGARWIEPTKRDIEDRERWNEEDAGD